MPTYIFNCSMCGRTLESWHPVSNIPASILCQCGSNSQRMFTTQVFIQTSPLSVHDQQQREHAQHLNQLTHTERERLDQRQEHYLEKLSKQPERPSFSECLDESRCELTARRVDYIHPTIPG